MFAAASALRWNWSTQIGATAATTALLAVLSARVFAELPSIHPPQPKPTASVATTPTAVPCRSLFSEVSLIPSQILHDISSQLGRQDPVSSEPRAIGKNAGSTQISPLSQAQTPLLRRPRRREPRRSRPRKEGSGILLVDFAAIACDRLCKPSPEIPCAHTQLTRRDAKNSTPSRRNSESNVSPSPSTILALDPVKFVEGPGLAGQSPLDSNGDRCFVAPCADRRHVGDESASDFHNAHEQTSALQTGALLIVSVDYNLTPRSWPPWPQGRHSWRRYGYRSGLHRFWHDPHKVDLQKPVLQAGALDLDMVGELEVAFETEARSDR